jgi:hypothetical protein
MRESHRLTVSRKWRPSRATIVLDVLGRVRNLQTLLYRKEILYKSATARAALTLVVVDSFSMDYVVYYNTIR